MNIPETVKDILAVIASIGEQKGLPETKAAWTAAINRAFLVLAKKNGCDVRATGLGDEGAEWLYDHLWYKKDSNGDIEEVPLVMEVEWNIGRLYIKYDFEKLLLAKSRIKVMIFTEVGDFENYWEFLESGIRAFKPERPEETYILAAWSDIDGEFAFKTINT
jgi:hypothetical protein